MDAENSVTFRLSSTFRFFLKLQLGMKIHSTSLQVDKLIIGNGNLQFFGLLDFVCGGRRGLCARTMQNTICNELVREAARKRAEVEFCKGHD